MNKSEHIHELATALSKAQNEIKGAKKTSENPFFKSSYADLSETWDACREALTKNGLSIVQTTSVDKEFGVLLNTTLCHCSGQWISSDYPLNPVKQDPQGYGSAFSYARRYALAAMVGVAPKDDDGEDSMDRKPPYVPQKPVQGTAQTVSRAPAAKPSPVSPLKVGGTNARMNDDFSFGDAP